MTGPAVLEGADRLGASLASHHARLLRLAQTELSRGRPTPFVAFDLVRLRENVARLRALADDFPDVALRIAAAVKACPVGPVLAQIADAVDQFDVQSPGEIRLCPPDAALAFHAPLLPQSLPRRVEWLSFNSAEQWRRYDFTAARRDTPGRRHGIRLGVPAAGDDQFVAPGGKFGIGPDDAVDLLKGHAGEVFLHHHTHRRLHTVGVGEQAATRFARLAAGVADRAGRTLRTVDLGGGWDGGFEAAWAGHRAETVAAAQIAAVLEVAPAVDQVILEPGRALFEDAALAIATISDTIRRDGTNNALVIDASSNFLVPNPGARFRVLPLDGPGDQWRETVVVDGTCRPRGEVATQWLPASLSIGDPLAVANVGAYTFSFVSPFSGPAPAAVGFGDHDEPIELLTVEQLEAAWAMISGIPEPR